MHAGEADGSPEIVAPEPVMIRLVVACVVAMMVVPLLGRAGTPNTAAIIGLAIDGVACALLAVIARGSSSRLALIVIAAVSTIPIVYFFGPSSIFAGVTTIVLFLVGILTARADFAPWFGWVVAGLIGAGQLALVVLAMLGVIRDRSLLPIFVEDRPLWQPIAGNLALQIVYLVSFGVGRTSALRYREFAARTTAGNEVPTMPHRPSGSSDLELEGYRANLRRHGALTIAIASLGAALLLVIVRGTIPIAIGLGSLGVMVAIVVVRAPVLRRHPTANWPGIVVAACSAGPAYAIGLHSGVLAATALLLLVGQLFRSPIKDRPGPKNHLFLASACLAHGVVFAAVMTGALADAGFGRIVQPGASRLEPYIIHAMLQGLLVIAYLIGRHLDARFAEHHHDLALQ